MCATITLPGLLWCGPAPALCGAGLGGQTRPPASQVALGRQPARYVGEDIGAHALHQRASKAWRDACKVEVRRMEEDEKHRHAVQQIVQERRF
eukprot:1159045-Pelagomonas_calceolata.AAC.7